MTRSTGSSSGGGSSSSAITTIYFWESLTGQKFQIRPLVKRSGGGGRSGRGGGVLPAQASRYCSLWCVFNHQSYYANKQVDERVGGCSFDLDDELLWRAMDEDEISRVVKASSSGSSSFALSPGSIDAHLAAEYIERELMILVERYRLDIGEL